MSQAKVFDLCCQTIDQRAKMRAFNTIFHGFLWYKYGICSNSLGGCLSLGHSYLLPVRKRTQSSVSLGV